MLMDVHDTNVRLMLRSGDEVLMTMDQLSRDDLVYVEEYLTKTIDRNSLRMDAPPAPQIKAREPLLLPEALFESPENSSLVLGPALQHPKPPIDRSRRPGIPKSVSELPKSLRADRSPLSFQCPKSIIPIEDLDFNDEVSRPVLVQASDPWGNPSTSVAFSISSHVPVKSDISRHQILRSDFADEQTIVTMQHDRDIRLLDHDPTSGKSLLMLDSSAIGEGTVIALADGWDTNNLTVSHRRRLPESSTAPHWLSSDASAQIKVPMKLSWARLIDGQHVLAKVEHSIVLWNVISGEPLYRIDRIESRATPAISGGKRYLAIPGDGLVDLHDLQTGKRLGRIRVERQVPGVSFSPYGDSLAIMTSRRLRVWNLPDAALDHDVVARESFGREAAVWIDHDFLITGTGVLVSLFRGLPVWKYDITGCQLATIGQHVAILRKSPLSQLTTLKLPHRQARVMLKRLDATLMESANVDWRIPGRSKWDGNQWVDREERLGALPSRSR